MRFRPVKPVPKTPPSDDAIVTAQKLKVCTKCTNETAEPLAGVEVNGKFVCAKCWIKLLNRK